jgi:hypothetical protein
MFKKLAGLTAVAGLFIAGTAGAGTLEGSAHDFSDNANRFAQTGDAWSSENNANGELCIVCHAPHNNQNAANTLLWNRSLAAGPFTPYDRPSIDGGPASATSGNTQLCLSCHDGTIALDSYGGGSADATMIGSLDLNLVVGGGGNLTQDHPVGVNMQDAIDSGNDPTLALTSTANITVGQGADSVTGTLAQVLLSATGTVECGSCHDPHNTLTIDVTPGPGVSNKLLKISNVNSGLCTTCHEK